MQVAIIDMGIGNLRSVEQALSTVAPDANVLITADADTIDSADKVVLPGQGAIGTWFEALRHKNLTAVLQRALEQKPLLGICVGMQALFEHSDEDGGVDGLGVFNGRVCHFRDFHAPNTKSISSSVGALDLAETNARTNLFKIPQMGWNQVAQAQEHPLWNGIENDAYFYFVHSYCANMTPSVETSCVVGETDFGHNYVSAVAEKNIFAVQFHPEKSHTDGLQLLRNFTQWNGGN